MKTALKVVSIIFTVLATLAFFGLAAENEPDAAGMFVAVCWIGQSVLGIIASGRIPKE